MTLDGESVFAASATPLVRRHEEVHRRQQSLPGAAAVDDAEAEAVVGAELLGAGLPFSPQVPMGSGPPLAFSDDDGVERAVTAIRDIAGSVRGRRTEPATVADQVFRVIDLAEDHSPAAVPHLTTLVSSEFEEPYLSAILQELGTTPLHNPAMQGLGSHPYLRDEPALAGRKSPLLNTLGALGYIGADLAERGYDGVKNEALEGLIGQARSLRESVVGELRDLSAQLPSSLRFVAEAAISVFDEVVATQVDLMFFVLGAGVGIAEGVVNTILGILQLLWALASTILQLVKALLLAPLDGGSHLEAWAQGIIDVLFELPGQLMDAIGAWTTRFLAAERERRAFMVGELVGELLVIIATFEVAASRTASMAPFKFKFELPNLGNPLMLTPEGMLVPVPAESVVVQGSVKLGRAGGPGGLVPQAAMMARLDDSEVDARFTASSDPRTAQAASSLEKAGLDSAKARRAAVYAEEQGLIDDAVELANGTREPEGLYDALTKIYAGDKGVRQAFEDAAHRKRRGHEVRVEGGLTDVVDDTLKEAIQHKRVSGTGAGGFFNNLRKAAKQLRGETGEVAPGGYQRIIDLRLENHGHDFWNYTADQLRKKLDDTPELHGVDRIRIRNGTGDHVFDKPFSRNVTP